MKKRVLPFLAAWLLAQVSASAVDSVVVFNEIHYHPPTNESSSEWIELHNQMAVDIDVSAWSITGGVEFTFAEGTLIFGGGYLVVAADPAALAAESGATRIVGPFVGRLNNSSSRLELRDRNDRLMDRIDYRDDGKWPLAPDGSGATLAKRNPNSVSGDPDQWTSSVIQHGTPGARNFPTATGERRQSLIPISSLWRFESSGTDLGTAWREAAFDDSAWAGRNNATLISYWPLDGNATALSGTSGTLVGSVSAGVDRNGGVGGALTFTGSLSQYVSVVGGGGLNAATAGTISMWAKWTGTQDGDCCGSFGAVLARQSNGQFSDNILALNSANPSTARIVWRQSGGPAPVLITSTTAVGTNWHHILVTFSSAGSSLWVDGVLQGNAAGGGLNNNPATPLSIGAWGGDGGGFMTGSLDDIAIWDAALSAEQIAQLAAQTKAPSDFGTPESAVYFAGDGKLTISDELRRTQLPLGPTAYYFRNTFRFDDDPARAQLTLDLALDDGAVFYLNGTEIYRHNMPAGLVSFSTLASTAVGDASIINGISLPPDRLVSGTNVLAIEVHQAAVDDSGMVFGAGLAATVTPAPPVGTPPPEVFQPGAFVFNEISAASATAFQIELINRGAVSLDVEGYAIARTGSSPDAEVVLLPQSVPAGGFLVLDQTALGFGAVPGDKLFLHSPGRRAVVDSVEVHQRAQARLPDGIGEWLTPNVSAIGSSNTVALHDEVVINEIMYHAPPTLEVPAVLGTNVILTLSNIWRYEQSGNDLGAEWRAPDFDDSQWESGAGLFYETTAGLPGPKNTPLTLGPTTYYFRTAFAYTGTPEILSLTFRHVIDDGAVFYLNGNEIHRFNLPAGNISHTNNASPAVINAPLRSPVNIPLSNLLIGTNILAVEVHQAANSGDDVAFGEELTAVITAAPRIPYSRSTEGWVELFNRGSNSVDLTGWRIDEGIDFRFASNTTLSAGGYLVVAKDPVALQAQFPGIAVVGPFTNQFSRSGENIVLKDAADNPADSVHYFDGGRWPGAADGEGSSLELRDPWADNRAAEAWAASDESARAGWRSYSYRGTAASSAVGPDGQWREFVIGLLDAGEVLLDDISVVESPAGTPMQLIQNGTFDSGTNKWRIIGNHHGEVIDDPDQPGNPVLRLISNGATEHMSNHGETTLASGRDTVNGREYLISFRAKHVRGSRQFHTRLYFNRLPRTTLLDAPSVHGTPGGPNTALATNIGPTYSELAHSPAVPAAFAPVTVSILATDPDGVGSMTVNSRIDGGPWTSAPMSLQADGRYAASLPGRAPGAVIQFYVDGTDTAGVLSTFPAAGPESRAAYQVDDGLAATNGLHNVRLVALTADADALFRTVNLMSNERIGCTLIYDEREIFYDVGLRLKGSEHSRTTTARLGFNVGFNADQPFRGVHDTVAIDRSESTGFGQREMLIHQTLNHAGGVPTKYHDLIKVMTPRSAYTGSAELQLARYGDVFLDDQFENGSDGTVFEYELVYQLNPPTDNGTPEGNKVPAPDSVVGTSIRDLGADKENYRWNFLIKNNEDRDDYSRIMAFSQFMALSGTNFTSRITNIIDVEKWLRGTAVNALSGAGDSYGGDGAQHNVQFYVRPEDGRVIYLPHDVDAFFNATRGIIPNSDLSKIMAVPAYARAYYGHLLEIIATTYNGTYLARWADHFGRLLPEQPFASHLAFIVQRVSSVTSAVNAAVPNLPFAISTSGGNNFTASTNLLSLTGTAPLSVKEIQVNGVDYPITWNSVTSWSLRIPLFYGANALLIQGLDRNGLLLTNAMDSIIVTNNAEGSFLPVVINEWMADNAAPFGWPDLADGLFQDWFELYNPNTNQVDLSGFYVTDNLDQPAKWRLPAGAMIAGGGFLLVWADNQPEQNAVDGSGDLHAGFQLNNGGEDLALFSPGAVAQHAVKFASQQENVSQGLFPDGMTNAVYFMTNWTPRAANTLSGPLRIVTLSYNAGKVTLTWKSIPGRSYRVDYKNDLDDPAWITLGDAVLAVGETAVTTDTLAPNARRFYRVLRIEGD